MPPAKKAAPARKAAPRAAKPPVKKAPAKKAPARPVKKAAPVKATPRKAAPRKAPGTPPAVRAAVAARRAAVLDLRLAGVDYLTIGQQFHADRVARIPHGVRPPWASVAYKGEGKALANAVCIDVKRALEDRLQDVKEKAEVLAMRQEARLERLLAAVWPLALKGEDRSVTNALRILERQSRLHGLDGAIKIQHDLPTLEAEARETLAVLLGRPLVSAPTEGP